MSIPFYYLIRDTKYSDRVFVMWKPPFLIELYEIP